MKSKIIIFFIPLFCFFSSNAWAHCPFEFQNKSESYCLEVDWQNAESRPQSKFIETQTPSPVLNAMTTPSSRRLFSKAHILVWKNGDVDHNAVYLPNLAIYPFMVMPGGHSHGARSNFYFDADLQLYVLAEMAFQAMSEGCWQLRLKSGSQDEQLLMNIESFSNLTADENLNQSLMCSICSSAPQTSPHHNH